LHTNDNQHDDSPRAQTLLRGAGLLRRGLAFLLDAALGVLGAWLLFLLVGLVWPFDALFVKPAFASIMALWFLYFLGAALLLGTTPGKYVLGLRPYRARVKSEWLEEARLEPAGWRRRLLRTSTLVLWPLEALALLLSHNNQRLGDQLAGTYVLPAREQGHPWPWRLAVLLMLPLGLYLLTQLSGPVAANTKLHQAAMAYLCNAPTPPPKKPAAKAPRTLLPLGFSLSHGTSTITAGEALLNKRRQQGTVGIMTYIAPVATPPRRAYVTCRRQQHTWRCLQWRWEQPPFSRYRPSWHPAYWPPLVKATPRSCP